MQMWVRFQISGSASGQVGWRVNELYMNTGEKKAKKREKGVGMNKISSESADAILEGKTLL